MLVAEEAAGVQMAMESAEMVETHGLITDESINTNKGDSPAEESAEGLQQSTRNHKPVEKLVISHAPMHKHALPKWKVNKMQKVEEAFTKRKACAAKKGNPETIRKEETNGETKEEGEIGVNKDNEIMLEQINNAYTLQTQTGSMLESKQRETA
ncbi:hypothetical protein FRC11_011323, partial [Ceratobasidium sp. 423]